MWAYLLDSVGLVHLRLDQAGMIGVAFILAYLGIKKNFEPLLLIPISFGMLMANMPLAGLAYDSTFLDPYGNQAFGLLAFMYQSVRLVYLPPLIFLGLGAITDFSPLIANPKLWIIGIGGQFGIFTAFGLALLFGFTPQEAASIGIIGSADGPTTIFATVQLAPHRLSAIAIAAYSYMALVPMIQPPIMRALTTAKERVIVMEQPKNVTRKQKILFPFIIATVVLLLVPSAGGLMGMFMLGNLIKESGVADRIAKALGGDFLSVLTMVVGLSIGASATAANIINLETIGIIVLGLLAFAFGTAWGIIAAKILNVATGGKINPLIGSSGVSAMPMVARVSQKLATEYNPSNFVIMHAMGATLASIMGSAIVAGLFVAMFVG
ncbi:MAG: sodium ion-translocating decarboxylase subunit beta [Spirochaetes bacterium]|nr:sodium ion-translocating decarboxylase subunit beta [Spirochaetota bacterium]